MNATNITSATSTATVAEALPFATALTNAGDKYGATKASVTDTLLARLGAAPAKGLWDSALGFFAGGYRPHLMSKYERLNRYPEPHNEAKGAKCPCRECKAQDSAKAAFYALAKESGVTAPGSKKADPTDAKAKNKAKNAKAKAKRAPRTPTKADADKNGYRATLKKAIDGLDAGTLEAMVLCWDVAVKAAQRGMKAKAKATPTAE
tara:strand:+ start:2409 stop:3026 length:618 start_codon:yes stop_codon:yes gene_type:complete